MILIILTLLFLLNLNLKSTTIDNDDKIISHKKMLIIKNISILKM